LIVSATVEHNWFSVLTTMEEDLNQTTALPDFLNDCKFSSIFYNFFTVSWHMCEK